MVMILYCVRILGGGRGVVGEEGGGGVARWSSRRVLEGRTALLAGQRAVALGRRRPLLFACAAKLVRGLGHRGRRSHSAGGPIERRAQPPGPQVAVGVNCEFDYKDTQ